MKCPRHLFSALLISSALLLTACGGGSSTPVVTPPGDGGGTGSAATFKVEALGPTSALRSGQTGMLEVTVTPQNGFTGNVTVELVDAPAGVTAAPVSAAVTGVTKLRLTIDPGTAAGILRLPVRVMGGSITQRDDAYAFVYRAVNVPLQSCSSLCFTTVRATALLENTYWVAHSTSHLGSAQLRAIDAGTGKIRTFSVTLEGNESFSSLVGSGGQIWLATSASGVPYLPASLVKLDPQTGGTERIQLGEAGEQVTDLKALPDGRLVAMLRDDYAQNMSLVVYGPVTQTTQRIKLPFAMLYSKLAVAPDGSVWVGPGETSRVLRVDPDTRSVTPFEIGASYGVPALTVTENGQVWVLLAQMKQVVVLNPATGEVNRYEGAELSGELHAAGNSVVYTNNVGSGVTLLLTQDKGELLASQLPTPETLSNIAVQSEGGLAGLSVLNDGFKETMTAFILPNQ